VLHVHDFNHVQVNALFTHDGLHSVDNDLREWVGDGWVNFSIEGGAGDVEEQVTAHLLLVHSEGVQESKCLTLGLLQAVYEDSWVDTLADVSLSLTHELTDEEHVGGSAVADDIILSRGRTTNHGSGRVLNLHLVQQDTTVFGELYLTSATNKPIKNKMKLRMSSIVHMMKYY